MQFKFLPIAHKLSDGSYEVQRRYYCRANYCFDWDLSERDGAVVVSKQEAIEWFRPVAAFFLNVPENELLPSWVSCIPRSICFY